MFCSFCAVAQSFDWKLPLKGLLRLIFSLAYQMTKLTFSLTCCSRAKSTDDWIWVFHALPNVFEKSAVTTKPLLFRKLRYGAIEGQKRPNWAL